MTCFYASRSSQPSNVKREMDSQEDRLSALPDDLILHILSSLELKQVIATSILSPRWRYLWTSVTNLNLVEWSTFPPQSICLSLAQFNSPKIRKFGAGFFLDYPRDFEMDMWIRLAVDRHVEEVDLDLLKTPRYKVVGCLLDCGSLMVLKLSGCDLNLQASPLCLPLLKLLVLKLVNFSTLDTSGCPLLERLILKHCNWDEPLHIYAPNKKLGYLQIFDYRATPHVLTIFAPYVCSILFEGSVVCAYDIKDLSSVRTATLAYMDFRVVQAFVQILQSVFHASTLELSSACVEFVSFLMAAVELPPSRTTCMKLKITCNKSHLAGMSRILSSAPYLEKLILDVHSKDPHLDDYDFSLSDLEYSLSTIHSLKIVEVNFTSTRLCSPKSYSPDVSINVDKFFGEWEKETKLLKSLVNSCKVLEKITISTILPLKSEFLLALQNRVLAFPKASSIAEICFS